MKNMPAASFFRIVLFALLFIFAIPALATGSTDKPVNKSPKPVLVSPDGTRSLSFGLTVQMYFEYKDKDMGPDQHRQYTSVYKWRRIRPTVRGTMLGGDLKFYFHLSTAPGALELMDFYLDYRILPGLRVRAGQCKIPFTRYRIQSFKNLQFVDWALVTKYFGNERQLGLALHNGYEKPAKYEYEIGLYTGRNARKSHARGIALLTGEPVTNPSDLVDPAPNDEFHPAIGGHFAYNHGGIVTSYETDFKKEGFRFSAGASIIWDAGPVHYRDFSLRLAPEFLLKVAGFAFSANWYAGFYEEDGEMDQTQLAMTGGVCQASYLISKWVEISGRYAFVETDSGFREDAKDRAKNILAAVEGTDAYDDLNSQYGKAGLMKAEREITAGVNVYLIGRNLKLQNDASYLRHSQDTADDLKEDFRFRSQLVMAF